MDQQIFEPSKPSVRSSIPFPADAAFYRHIAEGIWPSTNGKPEHTTVLIAHGSKQALKIMIGNFTEAGFRVEFFQPCESAVLLKRLGELTAQKKPVAILSEQVLDSVLSKYRGDQLMVAAQKINPAAPCVIYTTSPQGVRNHAQLLKLGVKVYNHVSMGYPELVEKIMRDLGENRLPTVQPNVAAEPTFPTLPNYDSTKQPYSGVVLPGNGKPARGYLLVAHDDQYSLRSFVKKFTEAEFRAEFFSPEEVPKLLQRIRALTDRNKAVAIVSKQNLRVDRGCYRGDELKRVVKKINPQCSCTIYPTNSEKAQDGKLPRITEDVFPCLQTAFDSLIQQTQDASGLNQPQAARPSVAVTSTRRQPSWIEPPRSTPGYPKGYTRQG